MFEDSLSRTVLDDPIPRPRDDIEEKQRERQKGILFRWPVSLEQSPDVPEWSHTQSGLF